MAMVRLCRRRVVPGQPLHVVVLDPLRGARRHRADAVVRDAMILVHDQIPSRSVIRIQLRLRLRTMRRLNDFSLQITGSRPGLSIADGPGLFWHEQFSKDGGTHGGHFQNPWQIFSLLR